MTGAKTPPKDTSAPVGKLQDSVGDADLLLVALQEPVSLHTDLLQNPQRLRPCIAPLLTEEGRMGEIERLNPLYWYSMITEPTTCCGFACLSKTLLIFVH
jgi:hypothetical protein